MFDQDYSVYKDYSRVTAQKQNLKKKEFRDVRDSDSGLCHLFLGTQVRSETRIKFIFTVIVTSTKQLGVPLWCANRKQAQHCARRLDVQHC